MGTLSVTGRLIVMTSCLTVWGTLWACSAEEENPATSRPRSPDSGTPSSSSGDVSSGGSSGTTTPQTVAICGKLGDIAGVETIVRSIVANMKADCRISILARNATDNSTEETNLVDCMKAFIGGGVACPGVSYVQGTTADRGGNKCQSVTPRIEFSAADWDAFANFNRTDSAARKAFEGKGLTAQELQGVAAIFEGKKVGLLNGDVPIGKHTACEGGGACAAPNNACVRDVIIDGGPDVRDTGADG